jgi:hypothetical protein
MAASAEMVRHAIVDLRYQRGDGRVQFPERKELLVAQLWDDQSYCELAPQLRPWLLSRARCGLLPTQLAVHCHTLGLWPTFLLATDKADPPSAQDVDFPK